MGSKGVRKLQHTIQSKTSPKPHFPTMSSSLLKSLSCPCSKIRQLITVSRSRKRRKALKKSTVKDQASSGKESTGHCRNCTLNSWSRKREGNGSPSQYSCRENLWTEEPGRLPPMGSQRVGHDLAME